MKLHGFRLSSAGGIVEFLGFELTACSVQGAFFHLDQYKLEWALFSHGQNGLMERRFSQSQTSTGEQREAASRQQCKETE